MTLKSSLRSFRRIVPLVLLLGCRLASVGQAQFTDSGRWQFAGNGVWSDSINWENSHTVNQAGAYVAIRGTNGFRTITLTNYGAAGYMYFEPGSGTTNFYNGGVHNFYLNSTSFLPVIDTEHDAVFTGTVQFATGFVKTGSKNLYFQGTTWNSFDSHRTTPVRIDQGSVVLNKGDGRNAIGSTIINGGSLVSNYNEQIDDYAYIQLRSGNLNVRTETFTSLSLGGFGGSWGFSQNGQVTLVGAEGYLFGQNVANPFSLSILDSSGYTGLNFRFAAPSGTASGGGLYLGANTGFNNSYFDLGGQYRHWYAAPGTNSYHYGTTAINNGTVQFYGGGTLELSGTSANNFSLVVNEGTVYFTKSPGVNAIIGDLHIHGGTVYSLNAEQIPNSSHVFVYPTANLTLTGETIGSLYFDGNSMSFGSLLTLTGFNPVQGASNASFVLMKESGWTGGTINFNAPAGGGGFYSLHNASFTDMDFNLGGQVRTFSLQGDYASFGGTSKMLNGGLDIWGNLYLGGTQANSLNLTTRLNSGFLGLFKTDNVAAVGNLVVDSGTVYSYNQNQIADSATVTQNGGQINFRNETIGKYILNAGSMQLLDGLPLTLTTTQQYAMELTTGRSLTGGQIRLTGSTGGGLRLNHNVDGISSWNGLTLDFGGVNREIFVGFDQNSTGGVYFTDVAMQNGGFTKTGYGGLALDGTVANTNTSTVTMQLGRLFLGKTANVNAIGGDLVVNGGSVISWTANQIADNATVTLNGGSIQFNNETIGRLVANGGSYTLAGGGPLVMSSTAQYVMEIPSGSAVNGGSYKFTGATGGGLRLNSNAAGTSNWNNLALDFNNVSREINVANGYVNFNDVTMSNGGFNKTGAGELVFAGTAANTNPATNIVSAGTLTLAKPNNVNSLGGDLVVNGGAVYSYGQNQIADNATVTQNAGNVYVNNETLGKYIYNDGGFYLLNGLPMTMTSSQQFAFEMTTGKNFTGGSLKFTGATGGGLRLNHNVNGSSAMNTMSLDFNNVNREINVANGFMYFNDVTIANGGFNKTGAGELVFAGTAANTNTATTIVSAGTLTLAKPNNVNALGGDLVINGGAVYSYGQNQIADNATVTQNGGAFYANNETVAKYVLNAGGFYFSGPGPLTLASTSRYAFELTTGYTFNGGSFKLTGATGGGLRFNHNSDGSTAWNNISVDFGNRTREVFVGAGTLTFNNVGLSNGALQKTGAGKLVLNGASNYAGGTRVEQGTLSVGNTIGSATGTGKVEIFRNATLTGSGSIAGRVAVGEYATIAPGANVGKLTVGTLSFANSSNYNWQLRDATGVAGIGYDTIQINGTLDLTASRNILLNMWTVQSDGITTGLADHFDSASNRSWLLAMATGGIQGWDLEDFRVVVGANNGTGGFLNYTGAGKFQIRATASQLWLDFLSLGLTDGGDGNFGFEPAPEPTQLFAVCAALVLAGLKLRRRKAGNP